MNKQEWHILNELLNRYYDLRDRAIDFSSLMNKHGMEEYTDDIDEAITSEYVIDDISAAEQLLDEFKHFEHE